MPCLARCFAFALALVLTCVTVAAQAEPCTLPDVDPAAVQQALRRLGRPQPGPPVPSRWRVLLPNRVALGLRGTQREGLNWSLPVDGVAPSSERAAFSADASWSVHVDWDLRPLWPHLPSVRADDRLDKSLQIEQLAHRLGGHWKRLRAAQGLARDLDTEHLVCSDALSLIHI